MRKVVHSAIRSLSVTDLCFSLQRRLLDSSVLTTRENGEVNTLAKGLQPFPNNLPRAQLLSLLLPLRYHRAILDSSRPSSSPTSPSSREIRSHAMAPLTTFPPSTPRLTRTSPRRSIRPTSTRKASIIPLICFRDLIRTYPFFLLYSALFLTVQERQQPHGGHPPVPPTLLASSAKRPTLPLLRTLPRPLQRKSPL